ncbi:tetratricopeptide repeat protein [Candidatus Uabimicrobium amorphum]|uniref:UDP-N-acetylglucosamine--peptide N-acetylglucosaminyltransferase SPINDLY n=1 Tax=Uabimicrobium amorphum TaxID=2596890 RepID=A0A5S9IWA2_UABAM|nr:tetratricopeptide repeat protein [Candidatus Uabimicrobium amorphum]BBM87715.1 hypothetical protein UABAM_06130 [Candidatus Uabimicrobium amorphum]
MIKKLVLILSTVLAFHTIAAQEADTLFVMPLSLESKVQNAYHRSITTNLNKNLLKAAYQTKTYTVKPPKQAAEELKAQKLSPKKLRNIKYRTKHTAKISKLFSFILQGEIVFPVENELAISVRLIQTDNNAILKSTALRGRVDTLEKLANDIVAKILPSQDEVLENITKRYRKAFKQKKFDKAESLCNWALKIRPLNPSFLYLKARVLEKQQNYLNAQKYYKDARRMRYSKPQDINKALLRIRPYVQKSKRGYREELQSLFDEFDQFEKVNYARYIARAAARIQLNVKKVMPLQKIIDRATALQKDTKDFVVLMNKLHGSTFSDKRREQISNMRQHIKNFRQTQQEMIKELQKYAKYNRIFLDKCVELQSKKQYDKALFQAELSILVDAKDPKGYYYRGISLGKKYKHQQAVKSFSYAIERNPKYWEAFYNRGATYLALGNSAKAAEDFQRVLKIKKHAPTYYELGKIYNQQKKTKKAYEFFSKAIKEDPTLAGAYYERGKIHDKRNNFIEASEDYKKAMTLDRALAPKVSALYDKSNSYISQQAYIYLEMGQDYQQYGELQEAMNFYKKSLILNPKLYLAFLYQGQILHIQKKYKKAIESYKKAIVVAPEKSEIYKYRCISYLKLKAFEKAIEDVESALKYDPGLSDVYLLKGRAYEGLHKKTKNPSYIRLALQSYDLAVKLLPSKSHYYIQRAKIYRKLKRDEEAVQDEIYARNLKK